MKKYKLVMLLLVGLLTVSTGFTKVFAAVDVDEMELNRKVIIDVSLPTTSRPGIEQQLITTSPTSTLTPVALDHLQILGQTNHTIFLPLIIINDSAASSNPLVNRVKRTRTPTATNTITVPTSTQVNPTPTYTFTSTPRSVSPTATLTSTPLPASPTATPTSTPLPASPTATPTSTPLPATPTATYSPTPSWTPTPVTFVTYYVSPNGSDTNAGTISEPWKTIQKAVNTARAGNRVFIRGGTYSSRVIINTYSGSLNNYITFEAYGNETPIIDGTGISITPSAGLIDIRNVSYIIIKGLTIRNSDDAGIYVRNSHDILILNNGTRDTNSSGIGVWSSSFITVDRNEIVNARNVAYPNGHEESVSIASTTNFEVSNNNISMNGITGYLGNEGIDVKESSRDGKVHHNYIHDFPDEGGDIYLDAWMAGLNSTPTLSNIDVYSNYLKNAGGVTVGSERGGTAENINIYNNVIVDSQATGIYISDTGIANAPNGNGPRKNIYIFNNTIYRARWNGGAGIYLVSDNIENIVIQNNLVHYNKWNGEITAAIESILPKITVDHNIVFGPKECSQAFPDCVEISDISDPINYPSIHDNTTADPKFVNGNAYDFHLLLDSPAIDSGLIIPNLLVDYDNIFRPQGLAYDTGAFEYVSLSIAGVMNGDIMANDIYLSDRSSYSEINGSSANSPVEIAGSDMSLVSPLYSFSSTSWPLYLMFDFGTVN